jgi:hypothetical protein
MKGPLFVFNELCDNSTQLSTFQYQIFILKVTKKKPETPENQQKTKPPLVATKTTIFQVFETQLQSISF